MPECFFTDSHTARWNVHMLSHARAAVHLLCRRGDRYEFVAAWEFTCEHEIIDAILFNFWRLDLHSIRLFSQKGKRIASRYTRSEPSDVGESLLLQVTVDSTKSVSLPFTVGRDSLDSLEDRCWYMETPPISWFFVELTNRCSRSCIWCPSSIMKRPRGIMPYGNACRLLDEIAGYRKAHPLFLLDSIVQNPVFLHVMGEPLIHPQFFEIIEYGHRQGIPFCLITNTDALANAGTTERLLSSNIETVILSLNSLHDRKTTLQILSFLGTRAERGCVNPRVLIQVLNGKDVLLPECDLATTPGDVEGQLAFWVDEIRRIETERGIIYRDDVSDHSKWPAAIDNQSNDQDVYFSVGNNISLVFKRACTFGNTILKDGYRVTPSWQGTCRYANAHRTLCILWDGTCTFCTLDYEGSINLGNAFEHSLESIWHGRRLGKIRTMMEHAVLTEPVCRVCAGNVART